MHNFYDIISSGIVTLVFNLQHDTSNYLVQLMVLAVFLPFLGSIGAALTQYSSRFYLVGSISAAFVLLSASISLYVLYLFIYNNQEPFIINLWTWFKIDLLRVKFAINVDTLSILMMFIVTFVSSMVHIYSLSYMHEDKARIRFMSYLSLFTFFMLMLVVSSNFVQLFFGWEGVGLCSYLLIGFWFEKKSANDAALKAFLVNRVGDMALIIGIFLIFYSCGSLEFNDILYRDIEKMMTNLGEVNGLEIRYIDLITLCLFVGCMGKSAQLGLHTWLPDAMEGPTPVSALIHAATMVTAGVFLVARCSSLFQYASVVLNSIAIIGALTAVVAATIAMVQNDIKRIIAYSTCSQLGYMFFACGVSAYSSAMFHLFTHAFFKALLFLGAGSVIHGLNGEQDITKMGGLAKKMKLTYIMMAIGSLALIGVFPFAGFYSKDAILEAAYLKGSLIGNFTYTLGLLTAVITAFYSARLFFLTFHGKTQLSAKQYAEVHESPIIMAIPMLFLTVGAVAAGFIGQYYGITSSGAEFWSRGYSKLYGGDIVFIQQIDPLLQHIEPNIPLYTQLLPMILAILAVAWFKILHAKNGTKASIMPEKLPKYLQFLRVWPQNKYYFDVIYNYIFVFGLKNFSNILRLKIDHGMIDKIPRAASAISLLLAKWQNMSQTGYIYHYAISMMGAIVVGVYIVLYDFISHQ